MIEKIINYNGCFVCGDENPAGLRLNFYFDPGERKAWTELVPGQHFEGYRGVLHGGIISSILDEVMIKAILQDNILAVTSKLTIEFKKPAIIGEKLRAEGWVTGRKGKVFFTEGRLLRANGQLIATGSGIYVRAEGDLAEQLKMSALK
ncbi:MAG: PaaI family thioesterase [Candidatus Saccharicenans sp.]|nr:MAG: PaaI family thioesterase [Candidatus Aminicenantes bacterium]HEK86340.1 PaaI family thioesterase [Candidatus Aminicenantes bacterium]